LDEYREKALTKLGLLTIDLSDCKDKEEMYLRVLKQIMSGARQPIYVANTMPSLCASLLATASTSPALPFATLRALSTTLLFEEQL